MCRNTQVTGVIVSSEPNFSPESLWASCSRWFHLKNMRSPQYWSILCLHNRPGRDSVCCRGNHQLQRASWGRRTVRERHHILQVRGKQHIKVNTVHHIQWVMLNTRLMLKSMAIVTKVFSAKRFSVSYHFKTNAIGNCWIVQRANTSFKSILPASSSQQRPHVQDCSVT